MDLDLCIVDLRLYGLCKSVHKHSPFFLCFTAPPLAPRDGRVSHLFSAPFALIDGLYTDV